MKIRKLIPFILALTMLFSLAACGSAQSAESTAVPEESAAAQESAAPAESAEVSVPEESSAAEYDSTLPVNVMVLNGTTGFGMASLICKAGEGNAALNYSFSVETDASNITAALINGSADIAALPTNAASVVYNKTQGGIRVLALNTLGVLYVVSDGQSEISSFEDLKGLTVYVPAQNPTFIFTYLCEANGLKVGEDIFIDNTYAQPAELNTAISSGTVSVAVLPEPMVTVAESANSSLATVLNLTEEWQKVNPDSSLVQGCVVVRTAFAEEHPAEVAEFLEEYSQSVALVNDDPAAASELIEACGIIAKAAVAAKAIPNCNICFITGEEMKTQLSGFLNVMFETAPASVGGAVPADDFYYMG